MEASGGIVLLLGAVAALIWANSPWQHSYHQLLNTQVAIGFGKYVITENGHEWINDGLMSLFFFLVGLEIKREMLVGELSSLGRRTVFPEESGVAAGCLFASAISDGGLLIATSNRRVAQEAALAA